ncbi:MAG: hypothetical protein J1E37_07810 [Prevotella sp.]|nr:hypothetical protein [Prevotella sp.]
MKKVFILSVFSMLASIGSAQTSRYDVNVYTNPFPTVSWTSPMGESYQRMMNMYQESDRNRIERERLQLEREQMEHERVMDLARMSANTDENKIVYDEVQTFSGTNLATKNSTLIKVHVIKRNNGSVNMSCMGIKTNGIWKPCDKSIFSLQALYTKAKNENERSMVLGLMDLGNYLLDTGTDIYIMK